MNKPQLHAALAFVLALLLVLAACGGGGDDDAAVPPGPVVTTKTYDLGSGLLQPGAADKRLLSLTLQPAKATVASISMIGKANNDCLLHWTVHAERTLLGAGHLNAGAKDVALPAGVTVLLEAHAKVLTASACRWSDVVLQVDQREV